MKLKGWEIGLIILIIAGGIYYWWASNTPIAAPGTGVAPSVPGGNGSGATGLGTISGTAFPNTGTTDAIDTEIQQLKPTSDAIGQPSGPIPGVSFVNLPGGPVAAVDTATGSLLQVSAGVVSPFPTIVTGPSMIKGFQPTNPALSTGGAIAMNVPVHGASQISPAGIKR